MNAHQREAYEILSAHKGKLMSLTEWKTIDQDLIDAYAELSGDDQWIHVDQAKAANSRFGTTIAHGNLTLSVIGHLPLIEEHLQKNFPGQSMGLNSGYDRVRFPSPLKSGSRIRGVNTLLDVEIKGHMLQTRIEVKAEVEGEEKPAYVAERLRRLVFAEE